MTFRNQAKFLYWITIEKELVEVVALSFKKTVEGAEDHQQCLEQSEYLSPLLASRGVRIAFRNRE